MDALPEIRLSQKLRYIAMVLDAVDPSGPMTESTRVSFAGEMACHDQTEAEALLTVLPAVPPAGTRAEYAEALRDTTAPTEDGAL